MKFMLALIALFLFGGGAAAGASPAWLDAERGTVSQVFSGESLQLADGRILLLAGLRSPKPPLSFNGETPWRRAEEALAALVRLAPPGSELLFLPVDPPRDRHRRLRVLAASASGLWLQTALLNEGAVLREASPAGMELDDALLTALGEAEEQARRARRGLWADPAHAVLDPLEALAAIARFAVVEGQVRQAAVVRGTGYLNFGDDWRDDFTVRLGAEARRRFERAGLAVEAYAGRRVRVRGWVFRANGPMIDAWHPAQLELLPE